ncbi:carbonic anhydrase [Geomonas limicola]|uniref:Carbonic anhydrase n=1 Tax=Geomonas limicola TaxID=2740186 RepID=A0A6V8N8Z5_9BACT|nr:carbonate dehydratase [Geomonas limicola]GFO69056.1 carbonic anhydrase [Geomonas limicola]
MKALPPLFENNKKWAAEISQSDPEFFTKLAKQQNPEFLWIGCSDSRVPANEIIGLLPGELFVHRNVANLVIHSDMNCLSVLQYAVDILKIKHIIVCGHYGCGGVRAALDSRPHGLIDNWLRLIRDLDQRQAHELNRFSTVEERVDRLCELNVVEQVKNVGNTTIVREAWRRGQQVTIHGWIYGIVDGLLKDMDVCISSSEDLAKIESR